MAGADPVTLDLLEEALGLLSGLWVHLGGESPEAQPEAVEAALRASEGYQEARREFTAAFRVLVDGTPDMGRFLDLEAAANHLTAEALEVGYRLGFSCGGGRR